MNLILSSLVIALPFFTTTARAATSPQFPKPVSWLCEQRSLDAYFGLKIQTKPDGTVSLEKGINTDGELIKTNTAAFYERDSKDDKVVHVFVMKWKLQPPEEGMLRTAKSVPVELVTLRWDAERRWNGKLLSDFVAKPLSISCTDDGK